jgi:putative transposase
MQADGGKEVVGGSFRCTLTAISEKSKYSIQEFLDSIKGKRKGKKVNPPRFKNRRSKQSDTFTNNAFVVKDNGKVYLAKIGFLNVVWSRPLPSKTSSVTVIKDAANRYFLSFVVEVNLQPLPDNEQAI